MNDRVVVAKPCFAKNVNKTFQTASMIKNMAGLKFPKIVAPASVGIKM